MILRLSTIIILLIIPQAFLPSNGQDGSILMTIGGKKVEAGEFIRMYKKSTDPAGTMSVDDYLQQFTLFKQKVADAVSEGYDTTKAFREELNGYRNQLAQNYLTDTQVKNNLLRKAYQRSLTEINAWHILVALPQNPSPADTLKAWKKANEIRERINSGEAFDVVAKSSSDDKSARFNGGNLGYFTVFQMIMPFEDAAYSMKKGTLSKPVRTPYGYHIIRIADLRASKGKVLVAHIMKNAPPGCSEEIARKAEEAINDIYKKLQSGGSFTELARQYSDHKESASKGGTLNWFGAGEMIPDFAEVALAIPDTGQYSKPFRTIYGWHIVKLIGKKAPGSFEENSSWLESRINQSYLNTLSKRSFVDRLKKEYKFRINTSSFEWFVSHTDSSVIKGVGKYDRTAIPDAPVYEYSGGRMNNGDFADYIEKRGTLFAIRDSLLFVKTLLEASASDQLISIENLNLEKKYQEFRYLMNEFHDGILLFNITDKKIWQKASHDSTGIHRFFEVNSKHYISDQKLEGTLITLKKSDGLHELDEAVRQYQTSDNLKGKLTERFKAYGDSILLFREGVWKKGENTDIDAVEWKEGIYDLTINGFPSIILVKKVSEALPLKFEDAAEKLIADYQEYLENEWSVQLMQKYDVRIDKDVLDQIKKRLKNE
jgi:peptidyl-prolyl cis-trans isomerase SurA